MPSPARFRGPLGQPFARDHENVTGDNGNFGLSLLRQDHGHSSEFAFLTGAFLAIPPAMIME